MTTLTGTLSRLQVQLDQLQTELSTSTASLMWTASRVRTMNVPTPQLLDEGIAQAIAVDDAYARAIASLQQTIKRLQRHRKAADLKKTESNLRKLSSKEQPA